MATPDVEGPSSPLARDASGTRRDRDTLQMINDCFRHQHPEAYGRDPVPQVGVPWDLQCGRDHLTPSAPSAIPEESMGNPEARALDPARHVEDRPPNPASPPRRTR